MSSTRFLLKALVLATIALPIAANQGGCASPSGRSCITVKGEILGQKFEVQWEVEWGPEVTELPEGAVYIGTANGMPIFLAPNGDVYVQFPGESGYRKIEGEIPQEIQDLIDQHQQGDDDGGSGDGGSGTDPDVTIPDDVAVRPVSSAQPEPTDPASVSSGTTGTSSGMTSASSGVVAMTATPGCAQATPGVVTMAVGGESEPTFQVLADFDVDLDADWAQIEFTATLPDPDSVALIGTLDDLFVITLTIDTDDVNNTITLGIEGSIDEVAKSLFVLGLDEMSSDAGALGEAEILFDATYSVVVVKLDGTVERIIPVRIGTD